MSKMQVIRQSKLLPSAVRGSFCSPEGALFVSRSVPIFSPPLHSRTAPHFYRPKAKSIIMSSASSVESHCFPPSSSSSSGNTSAKVPADHAASGVPISSPIVPPPPPPPHTSSLHPQPQNDTANALDTKNTLNATASAAAALYSIKEAHAVAPDTPLSQTRKDGYCINFICPILNTSQSKWECCFSRSSTVQFVKSHLHANHPLRPKMKDQRLIYRGYELWDESVVLSDLFKNLQDPDIMEPLKMHLVLPSSYSMHMDQGPSLSILPKTAPLFPEEKKIEKDPCEAGPSRELLHCQIQNLSRLIYAYSPVDGQVFIINNVPYEFYISDGINGYLKKFGPEEAHQQPSPLIRGDMHLAAANSYQELSPQPERQIPLEAAQNNDIAAGNHHQRRIQHSRNLVLIIKVIMLFLIFTHEATSFKVMLISLIAFLIYLNQTGRLGIFHPATTLPTQSASGATRGHSASSVSSDPVSTPPTSHQYWINKVALLKSIFFSFLASLLPPPVQLEE